MLRRIAISFALCAIALSTRVAAAEKIARIVVDENTKTSDDTVILIADIDVGDDFEYQELEEIKTRLVSSELFKSVEVFAAPVQGGQEVTILARDKHSWILAPTYYNQPGNRGAGLGFAEANLFGENKKLLLYAQYATSDSFFLAGYRDPSIAQSRFNWQLDTFLRREEVTEYAIPEFSGGDNDVALRESTLIYLNGGLTLGFNLFRAFSFDARLRGAWVDFQDAALVGDATCDDVVREGDVEAALECDDAPDVRRAPEPGEAGWDVSSEYRIELSRQANWYGIKTGNKLKVAYEHSLPQLGSEFDYWMMTTNVWHGRRGLLFGDDNLIASAGAQWGRDIPFQHEFTSGGVNLRGYNNRQFRGDLKVRGNVEYSVPLFTLLSLSWRALAFYDTAYTDFVGIDGQDTEFRHYLPDSGAAFGPWKNGLGGGIRVYFRSVVVPLLGWDVGYGLEGGEFRTYFAIGLTEL